MWLVSCKHKFGWLDENWYINVEGVQEDTNMSCSWYIGVYGNNLVNNSICIISIELL